MGVFNDGVLKVYYKNSPSKIYRNKMLKSLEAHLLSWCRDVKGLMKVKSLLILFRFADLRLVKCQLNMLTLPLCKFLKGSSSKDYEGL